MSSSPPALADLLSQSLAVDAPPPDGELDALLAVAAEEVARYGVARTSLADIARRAGVSRPTAYRRLGNKDRMLQFLLVREAVAFFGALEAAVDGIDSPADRAVEAFVVGQRSARAHPLVSHLLAEEPDAIVPHLTTEGDHWMTAMTGVVARFLDPGGRLPDGRAQRMAEVVLRLSASFLLTRTSVLAGDSERSLRAVADGIVRAAVEAA
jgi:TetR/AcrR family transcriptional repressor of uid operon